MKILNKIVMKLLKKNRIKKINYYKKDKKFKQIFNMIIFM